MRELFFSRTWLNTMPYLGQSMSGFFIIVTDFWRTLSFSPNATIIYLMISCEGELRNGTKYAELAYLLPFSGNSGVQKCMAYQVPPGQGVKNFVRPSVWNAPMGNKIEVKHSLSVGWRNTLDRRGNYVCCSTASVSLFCCSRPKTCSIPKFLYGGPSYVD